jgi:hypothetical protein
VSIPVLGALEVPADPMVKMAGAITIGAVLLLVFIGRTFRDVRA